MTATSTTGPRPDVKRTRLNPWWVARAMVLVCAWAMIVPLAAAQWTGWPATRVCEPVFARVVAFIGPWKSDTLSYDIPIGVENCHATGWMPAAGMSFGVCLWALFLGVLAAWKEHGRPLIVWFQSGWATSRKRWR